MSLRYWVNHQIITVVILIQATQILGHLAIVQLHVINVVKLVIMLIIAQKEVKVIKVTIQMGLQIKILLKNLLIQYKKEHSAKNKKKRGNANNVECKESIPKIPIV